MLQKFQFYIISKKKVFIFKKILINDFQKKKKKKKKKLFISKKFFNYLFLIKYYFALYNKYHPLSLPKSYYKKYNTRKHLN